jgi:hypothetical protein
VHADAHRENLIRYGDGWVDRLDQAYLGPRELDLLAGLPDHFHEPEIDRSAFLTGCGYDVTHWPNWALLRDIAELHPLASYIGLGPGEPAAAVELDRRVRSLRSGDRFVQWQAISRRRGSQSRSHPSGFGNVRLEARRATTSGDGATRTTMNGVA